MLKKSPSNLCERMKDYFMMSESTKWISKYRHTKSADDHSDFGRYQIILLLITQLGYFPVAATMLVTSFFQPGSDYCVQLSNGDNVDEHFHSLLMEWGRACDQSYVKLIASLSIMCGGVLGAFIAGYLADRYGRRPVAVGCLLMCGIGNLGVVVIGPLHWILTTVLFMFNGAVSGGYMVVNLTLLVEFLHNPRSRLLVCCLNGWSTGMVFTSFFAHASGDWKTYSYGICTVSVLTAVALYLWSVESVRWLASNNKVKEAKINALKVIGTADEQEEHFLMAAASSLQTTPTDDGRKYNYSTLYNYKSIRVPLLALTFCFVSLSIVSFGCYFNAEALEWNRFLIVGVMGIVKFMLGLIPYCLSFKVGRRPIVMGSLMIACLSSYTMIFCYYAGVHKGSVIYLVCFILVAASVDPAWKVNHLYTTELFPTSVRNMARGICNVGSRLGGALAPTIANMRDFNYIIPVAVFAILLSLQLTVSYFFLPETKDRPLPDRFDEEIENMQNNNGDKELGEVKVVRGLQEKETLLREDLLNDDRRLSSVCRG